MLKKTLLFVFLLHQADGDNRGSAEPGGGFVSAGGPASLLGAASGQEREEGATQNYPLIPVPERALHGTQVC